MPIGQTANAMALKVFKTLAFIKYAYFEEFSS